MTPLLALEDVSVHYPGRKRHAFGRVGPAQAAVDNVTLTVAPGTTLALVGESGSGKSSIGNAVLGLAPVHSGRIVFEGQDITRADRRSRRALAARLQVIFQNPYGSLNPSLPIGRILTEPLRAIGGISAVESRKTVSELLTRVGLPPDAQDRYPSHFSGGQRQRIAIARALAVRPSLVVCDEPTSALDVSTQAVVLELLTELQRDLAVAFLFITHDLAVVRHFAHRVAVLNRGRIVEEGDAAAVCEHPHNAYTQRLVAAAPVPDPTLQAQRRRQRLAVPTARS